MTKAEFRRRIRAFRSRPRPRGPGAPSHLQHVPVTEDRGVSYLIESDREGLDFRGREGFEPDDYDWLTVDEAAVYLQGGEVIRIHRMAVWEDVLRGQRSSIEFFHLDLATGREVAVSV